MTNRVSFIDLELKKCQLTYGINPCTAEVGVTGDQKCFNCRATCQDLPNIDEDNEVVRFAKPSSNIRFDLDSTPNVYLPNIAAINYTPEDLGLGKSIGRRASLTVSFKDSRSPDTDASGDNYLSDRTYDPFEQGTYWGKFRARYPFIRGQAFKWIQGTDDQTIESMETRHFVVESTAGPDAKGNFTIVAKDVLKLAQGDRAVAPSISNGFLTADITDTETSVTLIPTGIGDLEYPASGKAAIGGSEVVSFTRVADVFTIVRGQNNTLAVEHKLEDRFQLCVEYTAEKAPEIINDLLVNYADIDQALIPLADWITESDNELNRVYTGIIAQPTPVNSLVNELIEQTASTAYWDSLAQLIRWSVLKNPDEGAFAYSESIYMADSFNIMDQLDKRVSQVWVYYGQINPLLKLDEWRNYSSSLANVNIESETNAGGVPAYREIYSRWILGDARDTASTLADLILQRYSTPPRKVGFRLLRDSLGALPSLASSYNLLNSFIQDETGGAVQLPIQVTSINPGDSIIEVKAEEITFTQIATQNPNLVNLYPSSGTLNYNIYDAYFAQVGAAPTALTTVNVYIQEGFNLGSVSTGLFSLTTGDGWPVGAIINIYNSGFIVGRGGNGGRGGSAGIEVVGNTTPASYVYNGPVAGFDGGDALEIKHDVNLYNAGGVIGGGGGGGGGSGGAASAMRLSVVYSGKQYFIAYQAGNGGSGGAGYPSGAGATSGGRQLIDNFGASSGPTWYVGPTLAALGGLAGTVEDGGIAQRWTYHDSFFNYGGGEYAGCSALSGVSATPSANGGKGGDLGVDGQFGNDGAPFTDETVPPLSTTTTASDSGAAGGNTGRAVVQSGGTLNIIEAGLILGDIV